MPGLFNPVHLDSNRISRRSVVTKDELRGWIRALEWVLGRT